MAGEEEEAGSIEGTEGARSEAGTSASAAANDPQVSIEMLGSAGMDLASGCI